MRITAALPILLAAFLGADEPPPTAGPIPKPDPLPVRGFCIAAPRPARVDEFVRFIAEELAPRSVNTLILRVDFNFRYASHPELADPNGLAREDVSKIVAACRAAEVRIIPQINLLGHQSWAGETHRLLKTYPEFDETPWVTMPAKYAWPNPDKLYCKSYCPLHPKVHEVVFALVDEVCDAFEADAFHAGLDEVFYIGEDRCPRCGGQSKAELFAGEIRAIRDHLAPKNRALWIWGDRLLDARATGLSEWDASLSETHRAIDLIPKDVTICDWHYDRAVPTSVYFAMKGFDVVTCPWNNATTAVRQLEDTIDFRRQSPPELRKHFRGMVQTSWSGAESFLDEFHGRKPPREGQKAPTETESRCFSTLFAEMARRSAP